MEKKQLTPMQILWFKKNLATLSHRQVATKLLDNLLYKRCALNLNDLPDSSILCNALDELEGLIKAGTFEDLNNAYNEGIYYASEIIDTIMD